jgi:lipoprotein-anchoring transpeptidase ErfK/SrfK
MAGCSYRFVDRIIPVLGVMAILVASLPQTAHAGLFRMLLGGGNGAQQQRDWTHVTSRKLVPFSRNYETGTVVVSFADRQLYFVHKPGQALSYLIGTPVLEEKWSGESWVSDKRVDPRWVPTPDMRAKDPSLPLAMPGGHPRNPLGPRALYLGKTLYRIHGTDAPWTVGNEISNGCVRLYNRDIIDLYNRVPKGAKVVVTWEHFYKAASPRRRIRQSSLDLQPQ